MPMSDSASVSDKASLFIEQFGPIIISAISGIALLIFRNEIAAAVSSKSLSMTNLYSSVLSWASIQIGFAFGVYGFVVGKSQGFVEAIKDTSTMRRFLKYVKRANLGGFLLTFISLPLAITTPTPSNPNSLSYFVIAVWFMLFIWTFLAFLRIAFNFGRITAVRDKPDFIGA
ncbi:hypothetical protein JW805_04070 [Roseomonas aeriglobus]|nr:hypothetical protein [Roseomonas aeriglobus]